MPSASAAGTVLWYSGMLAGVRYLTHVYLYILYIKLLAGLDPVAF